MRGASEQEEMATLNGNNWIKRFSSRLSPVLFIMQINYLIHLFLQLQFSIPLVLLSPDVLPHPSSPLLLCGLVAGSLPWFPPGAVSLAHPRAGSAQLPPGNLQSEGCVLLCLANEPCHGSVSRTL